ncbi:uncharacterized protein LOC135395411 [Ornithodoros turicata]|uniref:uncharacterized protein LOC135395411 n=1 Tax=Ornithodoros turicata TaxID=34597 RepID=UPI0031396576
MDVTIAKIERNIALAGISLNDDTAQGRDPSRSPVRGGCVPSNTTALFKELAQITGQLKVISDQQRHCQDMLRELQNYTALSSNKIMNKIDEGPAFQQPAVTIQTTKPVLVSKTEAVSPGTFGAFSAFNDKVKQQFLVPIVEVKNNHRSPSGSAHGKGSVFHADSAVIAGKREDRLSHFLADLFGDRHNIAKYLRQATDLMKKGTETPLQHGKEYLDNLAAEMKRLSNIKSSVSLSSATARNLQFAVYMEDNYAPLRTTTASLTRTLGKLEREISPLISQFDLTVDNMKTVFNELSTALNGTVVGDSYYVSVDEDDLW